LDLVGYTNSYWVGNKIDQKSTSIYVLYFGLGPICWSCKKKSTFFLSSTKVDYKGAVNVTTQAIWLQDFLTELGVHFYRMIVTWCNNQSNLNICGKPIQRKQTKHIEVHMYFIGG
jgi:hypothetical protein